MSRAGNQITKETVQAAAWSLGYGKELSRVPPHVDSTTPWRGLQGLHLLLWLTSSVPHFLKKCLSPIARLKAIARPKKASTNWALRLLSHRWWDGAWPGATTHKNSEAYD